MLQSHDDEVGDGDGEPEPEPLGEGECVINYNEDVVGYLHQCEGTVNHRIEFDIPLIADPTNCSNMQALIPDGQLCTESHSFGSEPYDQPQVVACCGELDVGSEDPYLEACVADLAEQTCRMIVDRLIYHKNANHFPGYETQANNLINWLGWNIGVCAGALYSNDIDLDPEHLDSSYTVPDEDNSWPDFQDFTIFVEIGDIDDVRLVRETCHGNEASDEWVFPKPQASMTGGTNYDRTLVTSMTASITGPIIGGTAITGSEAMQSTYNSCSTPWCSEATFRKNSVGGYAIQAMDIYASSDVTLTNYSVSYDLSDVRITLADTATGSYSSGGSPVYTIAAGDAFFWVVGEDSLDPTTSQHILAVNSTSITGTYTAGTGIWSLGSFQLEYTDYNSDVWTITIPSSSWDD